MTVQRSARATPAPPGGVHPPGGLVARRAPIGCEPGDPEEVASESFEPLPLPAGAKWLTTAQVAALMQVSDDHVLAMAQRGALRGALRFGRRWRFRSDMLAVRVEGMRCAVAPSAERHASKAADVLDRPA